MPLPSPWIGTAYRHIGGSSARDILDFRYAGAFARNRWNMPGEPTLYLAGDPGVLVAEWGRQIRESFSDDEADQTIERTVYRLKIRLKHVFDLRQPDVSNAFGVSDVGRKFADRAVARSVASRIRNTIETQALLVPSIAFLDDFER
jgi:RES domain-containing protein